MLLTPFRKTGVKLSLNDPQWGRGSRDNTKNQDGKRPANGPPDLDQLWRDFNQRLGNLFGKRKSNGGGTGSSGGGFVPDMRGAGIGVLILVVIAAALWLASGCFIVREGQTAVVTTFGRFSHLAQAGFNWRWPTPIQNDEVVDISRVRTVEVGYRDNVQNKQAQESLMLTDDENIVDVQFAVQYTLKNAADWVFNNRNPEDLVKQVAETSMRQVVGRSKMDFVLYEGRDKIAQDAGELMQQILDRYQAGVQIVKVTMQGVQPPEQVQAAFDDAVKASQDRERQKNEGQAYANDVIPRARGAASRLIEESEAYRSSVIADAQGEAARFKQILAEYQKAPAITRERMYIEAMQHIFSNTTKIMVDAKNDHSLIYLPLDKLIAQAGRSVAPPSAGVSRPPRTSGASGVVAPAPDDDDALSPEEQVERLRSRDPVEAREREGR